MKKLCNPSKISAAVVAMVTGVAVTTAQAQVSEGDSSFRSSVRSAFETDVNPESEQDITKEFLLRTLDTATPKLDTEIPVQRLRDEGPRIAVKKFDFVRLEEFPDSGITREKIETMAEQLRVQYMKEDQVMAHGFTRDNLAEIAGYLAEIGARDMPDRVTPKNLQRLINIVKQQNAERGMSYGDLEEIAAELTGFYRQQGLFLAQVQIPAQDVVDGVVSLSVQEGRLGKVIAHDNSGYQQSQLQQPFDAHIGELVNHADVEEGMYLLNDLPGLNVTGYFTPGDNPGETALNLKVRNEQRWKFSMRADNHGSTFTGDQRAYALFDVLNPLGFGDALTLGALQSHNPGNSSLGQLRYSFPLFGPRTRFEISADYNQFKLTGDKGDVINALELEGVNNTYAASIDHKWHRSRDFNFSTGFSVTDKETNMDSLVETYRGGDHVRGAELGFYVDGLGSSVQMLNIANVKFQYGQHLNEVAEGRGDDFYKVALDTNSLFFVPLPFGNAQSRLVLKSRWQYADRLLPSFEQLSLGGAAGVRAFSVRDYSADAAGMVSAEWYFDMPDSLNPSLPGGMRLNDVFQWGLLADAGYGSSVNFEEDGSDSWARLAGAGLVMKLSWDEFFSAQISIAEPIEVESSNDSLGEYKKTQVFMDFTFFFK
ncbi:ShlB/FhaC/HecB family hemolysin secretion/activation protein [Simiduia sp. 21SJ11W-1]|uniref:ShlB/FhaC/HecB family hemolysin secretion/activation protein n=1 Tax=Simiduia sp. 21SJ11W-1 TaxID=2909669 RepID=UPI00209F34C4|nr:ShlB/FhaC/HecB family hemolysin secretion/activation protein [Simiduia sp. 21SJ11W-1]UTA46612.1 ShlB/FhaC/HecB family hemolysin secretion/activation protein [Simiduia sp. 21SJ11W-1]